MAQALDFYLRCNWLKCRAQLTERAVVTTCSHIFCLQCAERLGLSQPMPGERRCPACQAVLHNPDDAVSTVLNPTEDYKTSVLSGLDPNTIVECAGRALMFWTYQTTQEIFYQEYLGKGLTEKYAVLRAQIEKVINDGNAEIETLQKRLSEMQLNQEQLYKKNQELVEMYREKCKKLTQMTNLYNLLKSRAMRSQIQTAASDSVSHTLNSISGSRSEQIISSSLHNNSVQQPLQTPSSRQYNQYVTNQDGIEQLHPHQRSGSGSSKGAKRKGDAVAMPPPSRPVGGFRNPTHNPLATPQHRTRLPPPSRMFSRDGHHLPASQGNPAGYGLSVGMEMGQPSGIGPGNPSLRSTLFDSTII